MYCTNEQIWCKNIYAFLRNFGFRVGVLYFDAPCTYSLLRFMDSYVLNKRAKFGAKIFTYFWQITVFVLGRFILTHPVDQMIQKIKIGVARCNGEISSRVTTSTLLLHAAYERSKSKHNMYIVYQIRHATSSDLILYRGVVNNGTTWKSMNELLGLRPWLYNDAVHSFTPSRTGTCRRSNCKAQGHTGGLVNSWAQWSAVLLTDAILQLCQKLSLLDLGKV